MFKNVPASPNRFVLKVGKQLTGTKETVREIEIRIWVKQGKLMMEAGEMIEQVSAVNMQGVSVFSRSSVSSKTFSAHLNVPPGVYVVKVMLENGARKIEKVMVE